MKNLYKLLVPAFFAAWMMTFTGCKKDAENPPITTPTVTTAAVSMITTTSVETGGNVTSLGGAEVVYRGLCWSTVHNPTVAGSKTINGTGSGFFTSSMTDLTPNTTYYARAYATNSAGTAYGNEISFTSNQIPVVAILTSTAITEITGSSAVSGGNIISNGGATVTDYGVCWSTAENPTTDDSKSSLHGGLGGKGIFTCNLTGLNPSTTYFVRAYAINSAGVAYGLQYSFATPFVPGSNGIQKADFPGVSNYGAASFSIGTKAYVGMGYDNGDFPTREFWQWDQSTNVWTIKADFPGSLQGKFVCFSIGTKGYVEAGNISYNNGIIIQNEFWEYDPSNNTWTQKATIPVTTGRNGDVGFSIGTKGYIGIGYKTEGGFNSYYQDFWEWDQATNVWTRKADFPGNSRIAAVGFSIGNKGYIGPGSDGTTISKEFWEWDQVTNVWTKKADFGGAVRSGYIGFSIGNKGYIGLGYYGVSPTSAIYYKDIWEWNQATDVWTQKDNFLGIARSGAVGFSCGGKAYIGKGNNWTTYFEDFWEYDPNLK